MGERPAHRCTTRHAQAVYPFIAAGGLGGRGAFIGRDASGEAFCYDPWILYGDGLLDDPNAIVLGKLGQGKSALVKTLLGGGPSSWTSSGSTARCARRWASGRSRWCREAPCG